MTEAIKNILAWLLPSPDAPASERSHLYKKVYIASKASNNNNNNNNNNPPAVLECRGWIKVD